MTNLESLEIVDKNVWQPEVIDQLEVDWDHCFRRCDGMIKFPQKSIRDTQSWLLPQNIEVRTKSDRVFL